MDLETAFNKYHVGVYKQCFRILRNREDAEDAMQDVFLKLSSVLNTFRQECAFSTWLYRIAINSALMHLRKNYGNKIDSNRVQLDESYLISVFDNMTARIDIERAFESLAPGYAESFYRHDVEGMKHREAKVHSIGASKSQLYRARRQMRKSLASY